jgi:hypothetical protein
MSTAYSTTAPTPHLKVDRIEIRGQRSENRCQMSEGRGQRTENRCQRAEGREQKTDVRGQRTENRCQRSDDRNTNSEWGIRNLSIADFWFLIPE